MTIPEHFCAIDFETANYGRDSACSVGMVRVRSLRRVDEFHSLINQADTHFRTDFIAIHGITAAMTAGAPGFAELWPHMREFIGDLPLAAHNASFDMGVLQAMLAGSGIEWRFPRYCCSLAVSRIVWPRLHSHRLNVVASHLGIELRHHEALSDARACAAILAAARSEIAVGIGRPGI